MHRGRARLFDVMRPPSAAIPPSWPAPTVTTALLLSRYDWKAAE